MKRLMTIAGMFAVLGLNPSPAPASIIFTFTEVGGTVVMSSSGTLDTTKMVSSSLSDGWGGTGTEHNPAPGDIDIMGGTFFGDIDILFGFSPGTDASAITNPGGPFTFSNFSVADIAGSRSFTTYSGFLGDFRQPGIGMLASDIVGGFWTPDQSWTYLPGASFASLGMNVGTFAVSDIVTGETITIQVGAPVPEPTTLFLLGIGLGVEGVRRRMRKKRA